MFILRFKRIFCSWNCNENGKILMMLYNGIKIEKNRNHVKFKNIFPIVIKWNFQNVKKCKSSCDIASKTNGCGFCLCLSLSLKRRVFHKNRFNFLLLVFGKRKSVEKNNLKIKIGGRCKFVVIMTVMLFIIVFLIFVIFFEWIIYSSLFLFVSFCVDGSFLFSMKFFDREWNEAYGK